MKREDFTPNLSPKEIFHLGSFGGTYWRPIYSTVTQKKYKNIHKKKYPEEWWKGLTKKQLTLPFDEYDTSVNKYGVKVGTTLQYWEKKGWITKFNPYGWVHWYCDFYLDPSAETKKKRDENERQIKRWQGIAGKNGRFRLRLYGLIYKKCKQKLGEEKIFAIMSKDSVGSSNLTKKEKQKIKKTLKKCLHNYNISPKIRQTLQHWAYGVNMKDFKDYIRRKKMGDND